MNLKPLFDRSGPGRLVLLGLILLGLFLLNGRGTMSLEEARLYGRIREAQDLLWTAMQKNGLTDPVHDTDKTGFIGLEWSETSTTLGKLESKRNASDPLWGAQCLRWFDQLGLQRGDRIVVLSSSSFPGLLYSVLAAAESRGLRVDLVVSLGASAWGANRPQAPWPVMARILSDGGFLQTLPLFYTLGGHNETGTDMLAEGVDALTEAARLDGVELFRPARLADITARKLALLDRPGQPRAGLVVNIGGSEANLGTDEGVVSLHNGLLTGADAAAAGNGVIALALQRDFPVLHLLNLNSMADKVGITFSSRQHHFRGFSPVFALLGLVFFLFVLVTHKRWTWED